jgi:hypothetical protein
MIEFTEAVIAALKEIHSESSYAVEEGKHPFPVYERHISYTGGCSICRKIRDLENATDGLYYIEREQNERN